MKELYRQIISGTIAAAALGLLSLKTEFVFWFSFLISVSVGLGIYFSIPKKKLPSETELAPGVTQADLDKTLSMIQSYAGQFGELMVKNRKKEVADAIRGITGVLKKMAHHFHQNPSAIHQTPLLDQYLQQSFEVVKLYTRLAGAAVDGKRLGQLSAVEETIYKIHAGFQELYEQCVHNDLIDLEVKSETLKAVMDLDMPALDIEEERNRQ